MTNSLKTFAATAGVACGLIACASPAEPAQTATPQTPGATAQPTAAAQPSATPTGMQAATPQTTGAAGAAGVAPASTTTATTTPTAMAMSPAAATPVGQTGPATTTPQQPGTAPATGMTTAPAELDHTKDIRGNCDLHTNFADDHACLPPPKPGEGIQIHIGPSNYDDPAEVAKFIMKPGQESSECFTFRTPNTEKVIYQTYMISGRAGTHHMINTIYQGDIPTGSFGNCGGFESSSMNMDPNAMGPMAVGSLPGASKAYMPRGTVAPEYKDVGRVLEANALAQGDMHYFNFTDKDILREVWMNLYFAPKEQQITRYSDQLRGFGGLGWSLTPIEPGTDMVYKYECPIVGNGNIMSLLGHYHAHGKRFAASIKRKSSGMIEKVFEMYDYLDPATFEYNSITTNPKFAPNTSAATSGILEIKDGDILQWECHIINDSDVALPFTNEVKTGEMCNVWGYTVGNTPWSCDMF